MIANDKTPTAPRRSTEGSAGYDIKSPIDITFYPGEYKTLDTGLKFDGKEYPIMPCRVSQMKNFGKSIETREGAIESFSWVGLILPRSSLGFKYGFRFANTVGVIDQDYRDNIMLSITVDKELEIKAGDKIAQIIFIPYLVVAYEQEPEFKRNGGIGSTGR